MVSLAQILMLPKVQSLDTQVKGSSTDMTTVRTTRARIVRLRNDYSALMTRIEKFLHEHFASLDEDAAPVATANNSLPALPDSLAAPLDPPFAKVNTVAAGSPAETAGLKAGDEIRNFGYVNRANHDNLRKVAECVQGNEGVSCSSIVHESMQANKWPE
jgi:26S proteasome non-ATPase regulatory subunit 9